MRPGRRRCAVGYERNVAGVATLRAGYDARPKTLPVATNHEATSRRRRDWSGRCSTPTQSCPSLLPPPADVAPVGAYRRRRTPRMITTSVRAHSTAGRSVPEGIVSWAGPAVVSDGAWWAPGAGGPGRGWRSPPTACADVDTQVPGVGGSHRAVGHPVASWRDEAWGVRTCVGPDPESRPGVSSDDQQPPRAGVDDPEQTDQRPPAPAVHDDDTTAPTGGVDLPVVADERHGRHRPWTVRPRCGLAVPEDVTPLNLSKGGRQRSYRARSSDRPGQLRSRAKRCQPAVQVQLTADFRPATRSDRDYPRRRIVPTELSRTLLGHPAESTHVTEVPPGLWAGL